MRGFLYYWKNKGRRRTMLTAYLFIAPVLIYAIAFNFGPMFASLYLSFTRYNMLTPPQFIGLANYVRVLTDDPVFWTSLKNTAQYALEVLPLNIAISLGLALLVNRAVRGMAFFRAVYYLPVVTSIIAVSMIWLWLYDYNIGLINLILEPFRIGPIDWLGDPRLALHSLVIMRVWKGVGWNMVIYLAGLQGIPLYLYEAAEIDGASPWRKFLSITWPSLRPVTIYILIMGTISTFQTFGEIYAMTGGGPLDSTTTVGFLIYQRAFQYYSMGEASTVAFILFGIIFTLSVVNMKFFQGTE
jgi:multiple sugar transport system permease protein